MGEQRDKMSFFVFSIFFLIQVCCGEASIVDILTK